MWHGKLYLNGNLTQYIEDSKGGQQTQAVEDSTGSIKEKNCRKKDKNKSKAKIKCKVNYFKGKIPRIRILANKS